MEQATPKYLLNFDELKAELRRRGYYERAPARILLEAAVHLALVFGGIALYASSESVLIKIVGMLVSTLGSLGISTNAHTASHYATGESRWLNEVMTHLGFTLILGVSTSYWRNKHIAIHHKAPNILGADDDIDLSPYFAVTDEQVDRARGLLRLWYSVQWMVIPFAILVNGFNVQITGWRFLISRLRDKGVREAKHWADLAVLCSHLLLWVGVPMLVFEPWQVLLCYFLRIVGMGYAMFVAFAPAHFPEEADCGSRNAITDDFILGQTATTVNFRTGPLGRLLCSGVDFQIEHHLIPGISHPHLPKVAKLVEEFCRYHRYPYRSLGWGMATWKSLVVFYKPKRVLQKLELDTGPEQPPHLAQALEFNTTT